MEIYGKDNVSMHASCILNGQHPEQMKQCPKDAHIYSCDAHCKYFSDPAEMVAVPKMYYRIDRNGVDYSTKPLEGYKLHPIFMLDDEKENTDDIHTM